MTLQINRKRLTTCIHADTYQYFIQAHGIHGLWSCLEKSYGQIQRNSFNAMWIETPTLLIKAPHSGNPLTVFRKQRCSAKDINNFHRLIEYPSKQEKRNLP